MKILVIALVLIGCRGADKADPKQWPEVEKAAAPLVPATDGALLTRALEGVTDSDVTEVALADTIQWRKENGGLPWRTDRKVGDPRLLEAARLGDALVERRKDDPEAIGAALYLAYRLRAEGAGLLDCFAGLELARKVAALGKPPSDQAKRLAPTEAEIHRALATDAVQWLAVVNEDMPAVADKAKRAYIRLVVGAPTERAAYLGHVETEVARAQKDAALSLVIDARTTDRIREMFAMLDAYRAWAGV